MLEPGTGRLEDLAATLAEIVTAGPDLQAFQFELTLEARRRPELRPHVVELYNRYREATRRELARHGIDDPAIADVVFAALDGLVFQQISVTDEATTRAGVERLHQLIKAYLARGPAPEGRDLA